MRQDKTSNLLWNRHLYTQFYPLFYLEHTRKTLIEFRKLQFAMLFCQHPTRPRYCLCLFVNSSLTSCESLGEAVLFQFSIKRFPVESENSGSG